MDDKKKRMEERIGGEEREKEEHTHTDTHNVQRDTHFVLGQSRSVSFQDDFSLHLRRV